MYLCPNYIQINLTVIWLVVKYATQRNAILRNIRNAMYVIYSRISVSCMYTYIRSIIVPVGVIGSLYFVQDDL